MKYIALIFASIACLQGCQTTQLEHATINQAPSVTNLYYVQILSNIAMLSERPESLPYFSLPGSGTNTVQLSLQLNYGINADLLTSTSTIASYLGGFVFNKQTGALTGGDTNIQTWTTNPTRDPDQLILMMIAYDTILGRVESAQYERLKKILDAKRVFLSNTEMLEKAKNLTLALKDYPEMREKMIAEEIKKMEAEQHSLSPLALVQEKYSERLKPGWFCVGSRKDVPKDACYVGRYGNTYAWVVPGMETGIRDFSLVILNISTFASSIRQQASIPPVIAGKVAE